MSDIAVTLEAPESARAGDRIPYAVIIGNESDNPQDVHLQGRDIVFDVVLAREDGEPVWRRLEGEAAQAILRLDTFAAGERRRLEGYIESGRIAPGRYTPQALVPTETGVLVSATSPILLTAIT